MILHLQEEGVTVDFFSGAIAARQPVVVETASTRNSLTLDLTRVANEVFSDYNFQVKTKRLFRSKDAAPKDPLSKTKADAIFYIRVTQMGNQTGWISRIDEENRQEYY